LVYKWISTMCSFTEGRKVRETGGKVVLSVKIMTLETFNRNYRPYFWMIALKSRLYWWNFKDTGYLHLQDKADPRNTENTKYIFMHHNTDTESTLELNCCESLKSCNMKSILISMSLLHYLMTELIFISSVLFYEKKKGTNTAYHYIPPENKSWLNVTVLVYLITKLSRAVLGRAYNMFY
jgi:hypothetical protein